MIGLILSLLIIGALIGWLIWAYTKSGDDAQVASTVISAILGGTLLLFMLICPFAGRNRMQNMAAFYEANANNYAVSFEESRTLLSEDKYIESALIPIEGSIEKWKFADTVGRILIEWRNEVNEYNSALKRFQHFENDPFLGYYYPTVPEHLKLLSIGGR